MVEGGANRARLPGSREVRRCGVTTYDFRAVGNNARGREAYIHSRAVELQRKQAGEDAALQYHAMHERKAHVLSFSFVTIFMDLL